MLAPGAGLELAGRVGFTTTVSRARYAFPLHDTTNLPQEHAPQNSQSSDISFLPSDGPRLLPTVYGNIHPKTGDGGVLRPVDNLAFH